MFPDFSSSHALLRRADYHIDEFKSGISAFLGKKPYKFIQHHDAEAGIIEYKIRVSQEIPDDLAIDTFEIVNALRSSLDHAVYDAVIVLTGEASPKHTKFPFGKTEEQVKSDLARKHARIPDYLANFLLEFKPYDGGHAILSDLN